jgi:hypothetical protein
MTDETMDMTAKPRNQWWDVWDQFKTHKGAVFGLCFLIFITLFCLIGPSLWGVDPGKLDIRNKDMRPIYTAILTVARNTAGHTPWAPIILVATSWPTSCKVGVSALPWAGPR